MQAARAELDRAEAAASSSERSQAQDAAERGAAAEVTAAAGEVAAALQVTGRSQSIGRFGPPLSLTPQPPVRRSWRRPPLRATPPSQPSPDSTPSGQATRLTKRCDLPSTRTSTPCSLTALHSSPSLIAHRRRRWSRARLRCWRQWVVRSVVPRWCCLQRTVCCSWALTWVR
jgi:hypothetical protein